MRLDWRRTAARRAPVSPAYGGSHVSIRARAAVLLALALLIATAVPAVAASPSARRTADAAAFHDRLIVVWKTGVPARLPLAAVASIRASENPLHSVVTARHGQAAAVAARLRSDPRVLAVVPDAQMKLLDWPADGSPSDPLYADQTDLAQIGVPEAWKTTRGDPSVVVAVIDSGVDLAHPDLVGVHVVAPRNEVWNSSDVTDADGHGTHVTGTILADTNNAVGIAGIAPDSSLMPIKVASDSGSLSFSDVLDGVDWARVHGANIINMSLGGQLTPEQAALGQPTFTAARSAGVLMVAAAGNEATTVRMYPASFQGVMSVSAVDSTDTIADFSNTGVAVDIAAPGVDLVSTMNDGGYLVASGTSMASPHVAGVAALVEAARPGLTVDQVEAVLRSSAVDLGAPGHDNLYGDGRVDAAAALTAPVPDPIPNLDPPGLLPALQLDFITPSADVHQTGSTYTATLAINHGVADSEALLGSWPIEGGRCESFSFPDITPVDFGPTIKLTGLAAGRCYQLLVAALDESDNYAEATASYIFVLDRTAPKVVRRVPAAGATGVRTDASIRVTFSEHVVVGGGVRLRNTRTGLVVRARYTWIASTNTLVIDPVLRMFPSTRYQVEVTSRVKDASGNRIKASSWTFRTGS